MKIELLENLHLFGSVSQTAGLRLFARHASQFSSCLMDHYRDLFEVMSKLCGHINAEMKKTSYYALEAFLKQVNTSRHRKHLGSQTDRLAPWQQIKPLQIISLRWPCWLPRILRSTKPSWSSSCRSSAASLRPWTRHIKSCPLPYEDMDSLQPYVYCLVCEKLEFI